MKEFKTEEELRADEELQSMGRYQWQKVKVNGEEVFACSTNQQYEDIIWGGVHEMLSELFEHFELKSEFDASDYASDIRDKVLEMLDDEGIKFVDVYEEY